MSGQAKTSVALTLCLLLLLSLFASSCRKGTTTDVQGYVEGEFVYISSPFGGKLEKLAVHRGQRVSSGDLLFALESVTERAAAERMAERLAEAKANLDDLRKGKRPSEIQAMEAQLKQSQAALALAEKQLARQQRLVSTKAVAEQDYDRAKTERDEESERVAQLTAEIATARLGDRDDKVSAAEANVRAREADLQSAEWDLSQKQQKALHAGLVFDTLYREGEWVAAAQPVIVLLPPENIKVRAFVSQVEIGAIKVGTPARISIDGVDEPLDGRVDFISPRAEFIPPVIYSQESRDKLVFMVEIVFDSKVSADLHPGQPVDVHIRSYVE